MNGYYGHSHIVYINIDLACSLKYKMIWQKKIFFKISFFTYRMIHLQTLLYKNSRWTYFLDALVALVLNKNSLCTFFVTALLLSRCGLSFAVIWIWNQNFEFKLKSFIWNRINKHKFKNHYLKLHYPNDTFLIRSCMKNYYGK